MLVGRAVETAAIDRLLAAAREGRSGVLVVRGEAGIGKSALLEYAQAQAEGMTTLRAVGIESESELPFAALHQVLHQILDRIDMLPESQAAALRAAFGLSDERVDDRFRVALGALSLLAEVAEERPLLCAIDDAQWLDEASASALLFAAGRLEVEPIVMLFAAREGDERRFDAPGLESLTLDGLDPAAAADLLEARVGQRLAPAVREHLVERTAGNALALVELPATLTEGQLAGHEPLAEPLRIGAGVQAAFLSRVRRLPDATQSLLLIVAAEDSGELAPILRAALSIGVDRAALEPAEREGLVTVVDGRISFRHPLVRSAIYQGATFRQRQEAHSALAEAQDDANQDRRAWHRAAAADGPDEEIASDLEASALRATHRGGYAAAASALEKAALLSKEERERTMRLIAAANAAWLAGRAERARALLADAGKSAPPELKVRVTELLGRIEVRGGVFEDATAMLLSAADELAHRDPATALRLLVEAEEATLYTGDIETAVQIGLRAKQIADANPELDDPNATVLVGIGLQMGGQFEAAAPLLRESVALGQTSEDLDQIVLSTRVASGLGDDIGAWELGTRALRVAREQGAIGALPRILERVPFYEMRLGRYSSARMHAGEGLRLARELGQECGTHLCELAFVAAIQGREEECRSCAAEAIERGRGRRSGLLIAMATWGLGVLELGLGQPGKAMRVLGSVLPGEDVLTHPIIALFLTPDYIEAAARSDELEIARAVLAPFEEWAHTADAPWALALASHCRGLVSDGDGADRHFSEALELHPQALRPFEHARTELAFGEALRRHRKRREAREHLRGAVSAFERLGAAPWEDRARAELRATGETTRKRDASALDQLTPQELQIARLVGQGHSNKDVAAQLFLSPRTVEYHLRKVFMKLGITSRSALIRHGVEAERAAVPV